MKVKRLEIQGFKSFKDKTVIHFDQGVTGIVGPNGCGKSNIVDAFFWVMGEQSVKHMRADGQLDLIFNGSEKYAPLSLAEVTLVLETGASALKQDEDVSARDLPAHLKYDEISVGRRLFRDGTSEYQINGQLCRLKDIHELFMDTGAGPKAYSIIEQGQIGKIIMSKPEDRRVLVEEAAGIVKFKARKKESLRKIEATQLNLARVNDIVAEIERTLNSLERQAQKARQYKNWKEELLEKEMLSGRKKLFGLKARIASAESNVQGLEIAEVEHRNALQTVELRIENCKIQMAEAERKVSDGQIQFQNLQRQISEQNTTVQLQKRQIQEIENSSVTLEEEQYDLDQSILRANEEKASLEAEVAKLEELFRNADQMLKDQQSVHDEAKMAAEEIARSVESEKREFMAQLARKNEISNQVHGLEARVDALSVQIHAVSTKVTDREMDVEIHGEKETKASDAFGTLAAQLSVLRERETSLHADVESLDTELKQLRTDDSATREERAKAQAMHKAIEELVQNHEGMRADVRAILSSGEFSSLGGVFADKVEANPGFEFALESVLRDYLENFFVEQSSDAREVLRALKDRSMGRATIWAMDLLEQAAGRLTQTEDLTYAVQSQIPSAQPLSSVIRFSHERSSSIVPMFARFFVVETLDDAIDAFKRTAGTGAGFVTREGDLVDRYGRITGGSTKALEGGILARKAELQKLAESLETLNARADELKSRLENIEANYADKKAEFERVSLELRDIDQQAKTAERELALAQSQLDHSKRELETYKNEFETLETERKSHWEKLDAIRTELAGLEGGARDREAAIEARDAEARLAATKASEIQAQIIQFRIDFNTSQEKFRHARQNLERIEFQLKQDLSRKEEVESLMNRKLDEKDLLAQDLAVMEEAMIEFTTQAQDLEGRMHEFKNSLEQLKAQHDGAYEEQRNEMSALNQATQDLNALKLDHEKCTLEFGMLFQSMFQKYGLEEAGIAPRDEDERRVFDELTPEMEQDLAQEVDRLHERIRKLGEVNVLAVEEFDEQKKRHDFLCGQREDLLKSIADLETAIERINKTSEERFKIAFEEISKRFERIFPIVFGGGWGKIVMTNPEDLNETGVEIIAEPPGKKVGSIQLMSGGEKALTAVALIFSIFLIKPSPFCVLDEVDAPLDDHNVGKFNALLKEMSARSQFIIITHNKRTMELNDKLYGVTMEEPGVSKMVSIQLQ